MIIIDKFNIMIELYTIKNNKTILNIYLLCEFLKKKVYLNTIMYESHDNNFLSYYVGKIDFFNVKKNILFNFPFVETVILGNQYNVNYIDIRFLHNIKYY